MSPKTKKPERTLEARALLSSIENLSEPTQLADVSSPPHNVSISDAALLNVVESLGKAKRTVMADKTLSELGRRERYNKVGAESAKQIVVIVKPVASRLAERIARAREAFGGTGEPITGKEAVDHLADGRTTGFDDAAGQLRLERLRRMANYLLHLTDEPSKADELQELLRDAAEQGDIAVWASLDVLLEGVFRSRVLRAAGLDKNPDHVERMRRRLRAALDPGGEAEIRALQELGEHVVANARSAMSVVDSSGYRPEPDGERLEIQLARALEPLAVQLRALGVSARDLGPSAGAR